MKSHNRAHPPAEKSYWPAGLMTVLHALPLSSHPSLVSVMGHCTLLRGSVHYLHMWLGSLEKHGRCGDAMETGDLSPV